MRWGQLDGKDSGMMYLDLTFHQPADCKLAQATITMNFHEIQGSRAGSHSKDNSDLEVTEFFGPRTLSGEKRQKQVSTTLETNPRVGNAGGHFEGIGYSRTSEASYSSRWKFTGSRFTIESSTNDDTRSSRYRQLVWHLEENELEHQAVHNSTVHSALAFHHCSRDFYLDLHIEVKMQRWHHRLQQHFVCPPRDRKACTRARIEPSGNAAPDTLFEQLARDLDHSMTEANLHPVVGEFARTRPEEDLATDA
ncbi:hypothetical protein N7519_006186 [Penicillium mononematosum]|uniref:uncharacterized protein n=1 Tax=Penicillium mononematosum TaxID=268346 RepID=UPI002547399C|nr:uncharacterized protein N7519_006186 [Penicillium mononematosum]KAJ6184885.1 hypothetical protein N7519_006186 [Penicillium mononematosum]